jgi:hypothetical protein
MGAQVRKPISSLKLASSELAPSFKKPHDNNNDGIQVIWTRSFLACLILEQGCQMVCFQTKNSDLGKFWRVVRCKTMVYFMDPGFILRSFVIFYGHLVKFVVIWYIFSHFGILYQENLATLHWSEPIVFCCLFQVSASNLITLWQLRQVDWRKFD